MSKKDKKAEVVLDIPDDMLLDICLMAHKNDMTLNQFCEELLRQHIKDFYDAI